MGYERFTMFDNWGEIFDELSDEDAIALFRGMYRYAFKGAEPEFAKGSVLSLTWKAIKPNIDSSGKAASSGSKKGKSNTPKKGPSEAPSKQRDMDREGKEEEGNRNLPLEEDSYSNGSDGADVDESTPPESIDCPVCGIPMERTSAHRGDSVLNRCPLCAEEVWT